MGLAAFEAGFAFVAFDSGLAVFDSGLAFEAGLGYKHNQHRLLMKPEGKIDDVPSWKRASPLLPRRH